MTYKQAITKITDTRRRAVEAYERSIAEALQTDANYYRDETALRALILDEAMGKKIDSSEKARLTQSKQRHEQRLGLTPPPYACEKCRDTGRVGGKPCACAVRLVLAAGNDIGIPLHDFDSVDFSVFPEQNVQRAKLAYTRVQTILTNYRTLKNRNIVLMGGTGTGKTFLAGCAANYLLKRGESVAALTAFALNNRFLKYHTTFDEQKASYLDPIMDCELLIIDDLGSESVLKNVTLEYLYLVLNERVLRGKLTLVTTNLSLTALAAHYGERIVSRLFDKQLCFTCNLSGSDLRLNANLKKN